MIQRRKMFLDARGSHTFREVWSYRVCESSCSSKGKSSFLSEQMLTGAEQELCWLSKSLPSHFLSLPNSVWKAEMKHCEIIFSSVWSSTSEDESQTGDSQLWWLGDLKHQLSEVICTSFHQFCSCSNLRQLMGRSFLNFATIGELWLVLKLQ